MDGHYNGYLYGQDGAQSHARPPQPSPSPYANMPSHGQQHDSPGHATLPPLQQTANGGFQFGSLNYSHPGSAGPQSGSAPHTPNSASIGGSSASAYGHHGGSMPHSPYTTQPYAMSQSMMYPTSTATSLSSSGAPVGLPNIHPRPPGGLGGPMHALPLPGGASHLGQQSAFMQNDDAPTHVVGSQGRRGILPSAPGRPNVPAQGAGQSAKSMIPQKDADGKFPCPHCNKTYLHAKHLKRHLLRHTGDRPYMCHLCKDTFSRSDILKRHFQKCSIRRGNPTGANHLAHQRRNNSNGSRLSIGQQEGPIGLAGLSEIASANYNGGMANSPSVNGDLSGRSSRANTLGAPGNMSNRNSISGLGIGGQGQPGGEHGASSSALQPGMPAYVMPNSCSQGSMHPAYAFNNPQMAPSPYHTDSQPMSFLGQQSSRFDNSRHNSPHHSNGDGSGSHFDWNRMFGQGGQDGYVGSQPANTSSHNISDIKSENETKHDFGLQNGMNSNESFLGSLYSHPGAWGEYGYNETGITGFPNWSSEDPLQAKVDSLIRYCFPNGVESGPAADLVRKCLSANMVKHLAEHFTSYHGHWPYLHLPTFKLTDAPDSLVMTMLCIGAIYSPVISADQSRQIMDFVRSAILAKSHVYNCFITGQTDGLGSASWHVDDLSALLMLHSMFTWHGQPHQRQIARGDFPTICSIARCMDLFRQVPQGHHAYSPLHCSAAVDPTGWDWHAWLEQEKRNRAMYMILLTDAAMGMYFNTEQQLDPFQIRLPLPADDAAWDAKDAQKCAAALGMLGPQQQSHNQTGTRRSRQPGMREALRTLMEPTAAFQPGATNAYGKFILVHALITRVILCQRAAAQPGVAFQSYSTAFNNSNPATPLSQNDWLEQRSGSVPSTPTATDSSDPNLAIQQERKRLGNALDKWKRMWDQDIDLQYPIDPPSVQQPEQRRRRFGFSRDGVHFFYLGRSLLQSRRGASEWAMPPDSRFTLVMALLKHIKTWVVGDNERKRSHSIASLTDLGSVGDIADTYAAPAADDTPLTLDMTQLFRPVDAGVDAPVAGIQTRAL